MVSSSIPLHHVTGNSNWDTYVRGHSDDKDIRELVMGDPDVMEGSCRIPDVRGVFDGDPHVR